MVCIVALNIFVFDLTWFQLALTFNAVFIKFGAVYILSFNGAFRFWWQIWLIFTFVLNVANLSFFAGFSFSTMSGYVACVTSIHVTKIGLRTLGVF